jgi:hypothetical protein
MPESSFNSGERAPLCRTTIFGSQRWCWNTTSLSSRETGTLSGYRKSSEPDNSDLIGVLDDEMRHPEF